MSLSARILELERRLEAMRDADLARRVAAVEQGLWQRWQSPRAGTCTVEARVYGYRDWPVPGVTVTVTAPSSATPGSGVTDANGLARFGLRVARSEYADFAVSGPPRWVDRSWSLALTPPVTRVNLLLGAGDEAAGYYDSLLFASPVASSLTLDDPVYGSIALGWVTGASWSSGAITLDYAGSGGCPARAAVPVIYDLVDGVLYVTYKASGACPDPAGVDAVATSASVTTDPVALTADFAFAADPWFHHGSATLQLHE